jgi:phosphatidylglycerophosphate synthase
MKKAVSVYALVVGIGMICMWLFFIAAGNVGEFETKPAEIVFHLVAEFSTALLLITAAALDLGRKAVGRSLLLTGFGMLLYTVIVSPGYYFQRGEVPFVVMFFVLIVLTFCAVVITAVQIKKEQGR